MSTGHVSSFNWYPQSIGPSFKWFHSQIFMVSQGSYRHYIGTGYTRSARFSKVFSVLFFAQDPDQYVQKDKVSIFKRMRHFPIYSFHLVAVSHMLSSYITKRSHPKKTLMKEQQFMIFLKASGHSFPMKLQRPLLCAFQQCMDVKVGIFSIS